MASSFIRFCWIDLSRSRHSSSAVGREKSRILCLGAYLDAVWVWPVCGGPGNLRLHRPDPKRAADKQDKRMVVILNADAYGAWLDAPADRSAEFLKPFLPNGYSQLASRRCVARTD